MTAAMRRGPLLRTLGRFSAVPMMAAAIAGCHSQPGEVVKGSGSPPAEVALAVSPVESEPSSGLTRIPQSAEPLSLTAPPQLAQPSPYLPPADGPEKSRARAAFDRLVTPGIDAGEWDEAHQTLIGMGRAAVSLLAEKLAGGTDMEREIAATTCVLLGPDAAGAVEELTAVLRDPNLFVRVNAAAALTQLPDAASAAVPVLIALLENPDPQLRQLAAMNLNAIGTEAGAHIEDLARALSTETSPDVLVPVVELLGRIGPAANPAVPRLRQIAFEQPGNVAQAASHAIERITAEPETP